MSITVVSQQYHNGIIRVSPGNHISTTWISCGYRLENAVIAESGKPDARISTTTLEDCAGSQ
jgi:hypothetical protein